MKKLISIGLLIVFSVSCTDYCPKWKKGEPVYIDMGTIPDSVKAYVPYADGQVIKFRHNKGKLIEFTVHRSTSKEQTDCEWCCEKVEYTKYETDLTKLIPNYPLFELSFSINNLYNNPQHINMSPLAPILLDEEVDTVSINNKIYTDVLKIGDQNNYSNNIDSIYFSKTNGVLKIISSNGEYYDLEN